MSERRLRIVLLLAWFAGWAIVLPAEWSRFTAAETPEDGTRISRVCSQWNLDTSPWLFLLAAAPLFWAIHRPLLTPHSRLAALVRLAFCSPGDAAAVTRSKHGRRTSLILASIIALTSWTASAWVGSHPVDRDGKHQFGDLPPAYHDEYSYLFQAETYLAGRLWFPSHPTLPELFDQMHVLNEGKFASRYFPGTGVWMAPFVAIGKPYWGHWLAGALASAAIYFAGRELGGQGTGFVAGMAVAVSPGIALFSNLLLAHHPTLLALSIFLAAFLRLMRRPSAGAALVAGSGLSFAMLCRPMTAAGFALPFGLWMLLWLVRGGRRTELPVPKSNETSGERRNDWRSRMVVAAAMSLPLILGFVTLFVCNRAITGDGWTTPYQLYNDIYTPRHRYGFDNGTQGDARESPKVIEHYDRWAANLTPALAVENVEHRLVASLQWSWGIVPLVLSTILVVGGTFPFERRWGMILLSILSLHAVHIPYWFDGIMHWHYVFETAPLWMLVFAGATATIVRAAVQSVRLGLALWWLAGAAVTVLTAYGTLDAFQFALILLSLTALGAVVVRELADPRPILAALAILGVSFFALSAFAPTPFWPVSRISAAVSEISYSRLRYAKFRDRIEQVVTRRPALVLVSPDPTEIHLDYVTNSPALSAPVLIARDRDVQIELLRNTFPGRAIFHFDARTSSFLPVGGPVD